MRKTTILTPRQQCLHGCSSTFRGWPSNNGIGSPGDVRRCPHGRIWIWDGRNLNGTHDTWRTLSPFWEYIRWRRAVRALDELQSSGERGTSA